MTEDIFILKDTEYKLSKLKSIDKQSMIVRECSYDSLSQQIREHRIFIILLTKFHQLMFISYCTVLLLMRNLKEFINWMMCCYISDIDSKNLKWYCSECLFVNQYIASLLNIGWSHKSWKIFLLYLSWNTFLKILLLSLLIKLIQMLSILSDITTSQMYLQNATKYSQSN